MTAPLKADQQAAERVLKAAVRRAVEMLRDPGRMVATPSNHRTWAASSITNTTHLSYEWVKPAPERVVAMLTAAGESAALLLDERPAKKAAARKGAS